MNYSDEEKIKRLLDAQEHPEHYTDEELREIIHDARLLALLKRALTEERAEDEDIDVEKAWKVFSQTHPDSSHPLSRHRIPRWLHVAAVFLGCVFLAGVAFAAMTRLGWIRSPFAAEKSVFDNTTLSDILSAMGQYYGLKVVYSTATAKAIRLHFEWDQAKSVDANIAILNGFQQISITRNGDTLNVE